MKKIIILIIVIIIFSILGIWFWLGLNRANDKTLKMDRPKIVTEEDGITQPDEPVIDSEADAQAPATNAPAQTNISGVTAADYTLPKYEDDIVYMRNNTLVAYLKQSLNPDSPYLNPEMLGSCGNKNELFAFPHLTGRLVVKDVSSNKIVKVWDPQHYIVVIAGHKDDYLILRAEGLRLDLDPDHNGYCADTLDERRRFILDLQTMELKEITDGNINDFPWITVNEPDFSISYPVIFHYDNENYPEINSWWENERAGNMATTFTFTFDFNYDPENKGILAGPPGYPLEKIEHFEVNGWQVEKKVFNESMWWLTFTGDNKFLNGVMWAPEPYTEIGNKILRSFNFK